MEEISHINYIMVNTKQFSESYAKEIPKNLYFVLNDIVKSANVGTYELISNIQLELSIKNGMYIATLFVLERGFRVLILVTGGTSYNAKRKEIWRYLLSVYEAYYDTKISLIPPKPPYSVEILTPSAALHPNVVKWSEEFCKSLGWAIMSPKDIR